MDYKPAKPMRNKQFILYLLGIFVTTIILIVFLQYNSNGNINRLIHGNESLIKEFEGIKPARDLTIELTPTKGSTREPILCGIEILPAKSSP